MGKRSSHGDPRRGAPAARSTDTDHQAAEFFQAIQKITKCCRRRDASALSCASLNPAECEALACFDRHEPLSPESLATRLHVTRSRITRIMDALEEKGLLKRESNPEDGRGRRIELTVAGRRAISQAKRAQIREAKNILHRLPVRDRTQVLSTLGLLITVMEK